MLTIEEIKAAVAKAGKEYGIKKAYLFGSYAKGCADDSSDVDLLVEKGKMQSYRAYAGFQFDLVDTLGTRVDVLTTEGVKPKFFELIKDDRILVYGA